MNRLFMVAVGVVDGVRVDWREERKGLQTGIYNRIVVLLTECSI